MTEYSGRCVGGPYHGGFKTRRERVWSATEFRPLSAQSFRLAPRLGTYVYEPAQIDPRGLSASEYLEMLQRYSRWIWQAPESQA